MDFVNILPREICNEIFEYLHPLYLWVVTNRVNKAWNKHSIDAFYKTFNKHIDLVICTDSYNFNAGYWDRACTTEFWESQTTELYLNYNEMYCRFHFNFPWITDCYIKSKTVSYSIQSTFWEPLCETKLEDAGCSPFFEVQEISLKQLNKEIKSELVDNVITYYSAEEIDVERYKINLTHIEMPLKILLGWDGCLKIDRELSELLDSAKKCQNCRLHLRSKYCSVKYCSVNMCSICRKQNTKKCRKHR